ncbi:MAG TPA: NfeD family protein [Solirubrobacteraceae bacterium]|nr:NfeD family protein [Solirubrobacteraceae bacterium]
MEAWIVWAVLAVILAVGEILTTSFFLFPFALGAVAAAIVDLAGGGGTPQAVAFVVVTALSLGIVRPIARRHLSMPAQLRTGTDALVGRTAVVTETIANDAGHGAIRIDGEVWTARAFDDDDVIEAGRRVTVMDIKGATALVSE